MKAIKQSRQSQNQLDEIVYRVTQAEVRRVITQEVRMRLDNAAISRAVESQINNMLNDIGINTTTNYAA